MKEKEAKYLKWKTNKERGILLNVMWQLGSGVRGLGGEWRHVYIWLNPFAVCLKQSQ